MPKLKTNDNRRITLPKPQVPSNVCSYTYEQYRDQRVTIDNVPSTEIQALTTDFKTSISDPIHNLNPEIEMGQYFVVPVQEIMAMLSVANEDATFIHICNGLRHQTNSNGEKKSFTVTILVPVHKVTKNKIESYEVCDGADSIYVETYPCPPDPRCPTVVNLIKGIFDSNTIINDFDNFK